MNKNEWEICKLNTKTTNNNIPNILKQKININYFL